MTLPVKDFIIQRLLESDPTFETGAGTPVVGLFIDPLSVVLQPIVDELTLVQASQSILTIEESSDPDSFPEDIVDGLVSNMFVDRRAGNVGSAVQRIRFFTPVEFASQQGLLVFRGESEQRYTNSEALSVTSSEMGLNQEGSLFFVDIPIISLEEGTVFNADAGTITTMEASPDQFANTTNITDVQDGADRETNTELLSRARVAVAVRALVTGRGIVVQLTENFSTIDEIIPIGLGDPEMMRDIVFNTHIGGNVDVWIKTTTRNSGQQDFFTIPVDTTRQQEGNTIVALTVLDVAFPLDDSSIDQSTNPVVVSNIENTLIFRDVLDYIIDDVAGTIVRVSGSGIFHIDTINGTIPAAVPPGKLNRIKSAGPTEYQSVRAGMILSVTSPASVAGTYTVKEVVSADELEVFGLFPATAVSVIAQVDDNLMVGYEFNPVSIDLVQEPRSTARESYTIIDVPFMRIVGMEFLDPLSGDPIGVPLNENGGYGGGGYGVGSYGKGESSDFQIIVTQPNIRYSSKHDDYIQLESRFLGTSVRVSYEYAGSIPAIQAFMDDRSNQSQSADLLAKHVIPAYVDTPEIVIYDVPLADQETALTVDAMTEIIVKAIDDISNGDDLEVSDLVDVLYDNGASRVDMGAIDAIRAEIHHTDGSTEILVTDDSGVIAMPNEPLPDPTDKPISNRIGRFIARTITLERVFV